MVYKKYITRNGKKYGPYYYESYRENGKVKTRFVSGPKIRDKFKNNKKIISLFFIFGIFLFLGFLFFAGFSDNQGLNSGSGILGFVINENIDEADKKIPIFK